MKLLRYIFTIASLTIFVQKSFGTAQIPDFIIYKGDTLSIQANPLEGYFVNHPRPDSIFEKYGNHTTACWRRYIGYWELRNDSLFLLRLQGDSTDFDLSVIFKDRKTDGEIFADWVSFSILNPYGKLMHYEHSDYWSTYEFEREFIFSNGILTGIKHYDNSKSKRSKFTDNLVMLKKYIEEHIDYLNITNEPYEPAKVYVEISHVTDDGIIDSVTVMRGWDKERDREAVRVVKSIPEWEVVYRHGKRIQLPWIIPVVFGRKEE